MNRESIEKDAKNFAWAHQNICVNKNTGVPHDITPCKVSEMRMIPIYNEIQHAYLCGALDAVRQCIAIIRDKADEYVDMDRSKRGDYFKKPTAYWFLNCEPHHGYTLQPRRDTKAVNDAKPSAKAGICSKERSEISPEYAYNFICDQILGCRNKNDKQLKLF